MKRIVICADGTWNERDQVDDGTGRRCPTNVTKVARTVRAKASGSIDQVVAYHNGVGTGGPLDRVTGGAFGSGICANLVALYRFILYNYVPGDQLYFFGFSRGAFTVRTLAGFMNRVGLLDKDDDYYVPEMLALYEDGVKPDSDAWRKAFHRADQRPCPRIDFIGVWDTVGALGAPGYLGRLVNRGKYRFHDVELNPHIAHAYHALAIDEHRTPFEPSLWRRPDGWSGVLEQAWFCGVHCNVGGGYKPDGTANNALHWIVEKAEDLGLEFDHEALDHYAPYPSGTKHESMTTFYRPLGVLQRPIGAHRAHGEALHSSVRKRYDADKDYRPKNLPESLLDGGTNALPVVDSPRHRQRNPSPPAAAIAPTAAAAIA
jgi:uncharacterized protein (DUF2235 family)